MSFSALRRYAVFLSVVLCLGISVVCTAAPIEVKAGLTENKARLGDEIIVIVEVLRTADTEVRVPAAGADLSPFEVKGSALLRSVNEQGKVREVHRLVLTVFELGDLRLPPVPVSFKGSSGSGTVATDAFKIQVVSVGKKKGDKDDIRSIKGPAVFGRNARRNLLIGVLVFLLLGLTAFIFVKKRRKGFIDPEALKPPHERVGLELGRLQKRGLLEAGQVKEYYSELSDILRRYLERRFGVPAFEQTTFETVKALKEKGLPQSVQERMKNLLETSDLVKFAKFVPPQSMAQTLAGDLLRIADETKPEPEPEPAGDGKKK